MKHFLFLRVGLALVLGEIAGEAAIAMKMNPSTAHQLRVETMADGSLELTTLGVDPFVEMHPLDPGKVGADEHILAFEYFSPQGVDGLEVYYGPPMTPARRLEAGSLVRAESWLPAAIDLWSLSGGKWSARHRVLRLDFGGRSGLVLRVRGFQLRHPTDKERQSAEERLAERRSKLAREEILNTYYLTRFSDQLSGVEVIDQTLFIHGVVSGEVMNPVLLEWRPHISLADHGWLDGARPCIHPVEGAREVQSLAQGGPFSLEVPRFNKAGEDRNTSRWVVAERLEGEGWRLLTHARHADLPLPETSPEVPKLSPADRKGMTGVSSAFPLDELLELGVKHITINLPISHLLDLQAGPGTQPMLLAGRTWHVNERRLQEWDRLARFSQKHGLTASGILLINFYNGPIGRLLTHPEADRAGHYAMPNLTTQESIAAYEGVLELLARRYGPKDSPYGHIAHWIVHNEVGYGWEWTNMGSQPPMLYMDHYLRSMRLVHDVMRRQNPEARVFISLTHHWNVPSNPDWKSYSNRDLLERLLQSSRLEGDFAWGIAYHPYPQNLRRPEAWKDTRVNDSFDTPLITPKNIEVLDRWMHRPEVRDARGRLRPVFLSEQGANMPEDTEDGRSLQAAGLAYMWKQLEGLESIRAFHYHRWVDHPLEGGLLLGLRGLPGGGRPYGERKPSWYLYQALGTPAQDEAVQPYQKWMDQP